MNRELFTSDASLIITFLASFLIWFMLGGLVFLWLIDGRVKREQAMHAFLSGTFAWVLSTMIKSITPSIRPFEFYGIIPSTITIPSDASFPSSHAAIAFAIAYSIWTHNKKMGWRFLTIALLVAAGRVLSSVHYLQDVLVGSLLGISASIIVRKLHTYKLVK